MTKINLKNKIKVIGLASGKIVNLTIQSKDDLELNLMKFLQKNKIPIATTCLGEGVCKKCVINYDLISCLITVKDFLSRENQEIKIEYF